MCIFCLAAIWNLLLIYCCIIVHRKELGSSTNNQGCGAGTQISGLGSKLQLLSSKLFGLRLHSPAFKTSLSYVLIGRIVLGVYANA